MLMKKRVQLGTFSRGGYTGRIKNQVSRARDWIIRNLDPRAREKVGDIVDKISLITRTQQHPTTEPVRCLGMFSHQRHRFGQPES